MTPSLDFDVLTIIISQIQLEDPYDYKSLYYCMLVDKKWCEAGIPILWQNPFAFNEISSKYPLSSGRIIEVLLSCFNKEQIKELYEKMQAEFPNFFEAESTKPSLFRRLQTFNKPSFNYPSYIKSLSYRGLFMSTIMWLKSSPYNDHFGDQSSTQIFLKLIIRSLLKLFTSNQMKFRRVIIEGMNDNQMKFKKGIIDGINGMNDESYWWEYYIFSKMLFEQEFKSLFGSIRKLDIEGVDEEQVEEMVNGWKDFSTLKTLKVQINKHLSTIVSNTPFLRKIYINKGDIHFLLPLLASPIPSRTLTSITLHNVKFDKSDQWELLSSLHNLEKLKLIVCWIHPDVDSDARQDMISKVTNIRFKKLKLFVCANENDNGMTIEDESKQLLLQWGVSQHALVVSENFEDSRVRVFHESLERVNLVGVEGVRAKRNLYQNYMKLVKKAQKEQELKKNKTQENSSINTIQHLSEEEDLIARFTH
ncbi:hypothetical protein C2G38_2211982 [Gigaspora rosea]|uniref:F-box domain-containing protein n=1 Tax=Gigaspora rosea TaxID=44941 RepID=A0A397UDU0_9GLOM|nr:hypothetical protein C2G38_2211982 [Gigaspora rosea]